MLGGFNVAAEAAAQKSSLMSARAKRGITFRNPKADSSGQSAPSGMTLSNFWPQPLGTHQQPQIVNAAPVGGGLAKRSILLSNRIKKAGRHVSRMKV